MSAKTGTAVVLILVNVLLYGSWYWLGDQPLTGNRRDAFLETRYLPDGPETRLSTSSILRNDGYAVPFFELMEKEKRIIMFGTSESIHPHNISYQMNAISDELPKTYIFSQAGMSPIHLSFFFAKCERDKLQIPPVVLLVNLVYFTNSHDVLNDGWLTRVLPSDSFAQLNHGDVLDYVDEDVRDLFEDHYANRRWLMPITSQKHLGGLWFLNFNQPNPLAPAPDGMANDRYEYNGKLPNYDDARNVWKGYHPRDEMQKSRWEVRKVEECLNLIGLRSIVNSAEACNAPMMVIVMPTNKPYYKASGLDMDRYEERYTKIREAIKALPQKSSTEVMDLYEDMELDKGFKDRMHADQYGHYQMANHILETPEYQAFRQRAAEYFAERENK